MKILTLTALFVFCLCESALAGVEPVKVPEAGTTIGLLTLAIAGITLASRKLKR